MRKLLAVSLILAAVVLSMLVLTDPGTAQAGPASLNRLLAVTLTPTPPTANKLPPTGILVPTPGATPNTNPIAGGNQPDNPALALIGLGGLLLVAGLAIRSRRRKIA